MEHTFPQLQGFNQLKGKEHYTSYRLLWMTLLWRISHPIRLCIHMYVLCTCYVVCMHFDNQVHVYWMEFCFIIQNSLFNVHESVLHAFAILCLFNNGSHIALCVLALWLELVWVGGNVSTVSCQSVQKLHHLICISATSVVLLHPPWCMGEHLDPGTGASTKKWAWQKWHCVHVGATNSWGTE